MHKGKSLRSLIAAAVLGSLWLILLGIGWGFLPSQTPIHAQEVIPADAASVDNWGPPGFNMELVGHIGGNMNNVAVQGDYAYVGMGISFVVLDITTPTTPTIVGSVLVPGL